MSLVLRGWCWPPCSCPASCGGVAAPGPPALGVAAPGPPPLRVAAPGPPALGVAAPFHCPEAEGKLAT